MTFMKRNPEAILGVAEQEDQLQSPHRTLETSNILNIESESNIGGLVRPARISGYVRPQSGKIYRSKMSLRTKGDTEKALDRLRQLQLQGGTSFSRD